MKTKLVLFLLIAPICAYSQWIPDKLLSNPILLERDSNKLSVDVEAIGFLKNNEYFSPIVKGETLPDIRIRSTVGYQVGTQFRAEVGMAGLYYSGDQQKKGTYIFIKSDRRFFKVNFRDILFIEGLKDYVIIHSDNKRIIARMYLKMIQEQLPKTFLRINKSYIVNSDHIESFDNNDVFIRKHEIAIGNNYRDTFFSGFAGKLP